ncbi:hypothetical protein SAMN05444162_0130 [Paenibacillaceae bacterium GAS479]|nr:hypothetical protein SAMN05444162_0130 [Paenibacillaceae bacterium GAS479]
MTPDFRKASRAQLYVILCDDMANSVDKHQAAEEIYRRRKLPGGRVEYKKQVRYPK